MKSEVYWEKRRELEDEARLKMERKTLKKIESVFPAALEKIEEQLLSQADLHGMTLDGLLSDFNNRDQKKYRDYVDKNYKQLMQSDEKYQEFIDEFFPAYDYAKVNRLMQIRADIFSTLASETIDADLNGRFNSGLEDIVNRTYNSNSNALMQLVVSGDFSPLSQSDLQEMLNYPWSGKTFSNRLWGNISKLEQNLSQSIVNAVQSGEGVEEALRTMRNDEGISDMFKQEKDKFNRAIENLVRTEYAHFAVEGIEKSYKDAGIEKYRNYSAEDERVCSTCGAMHGKVFKVSEGVAGVTKPVWHTKCRCTTTPVMKDLPEDIDEIYEEMFGDTLDEFAKEQFGIKLNHPKKNRS